MATNHLGNWSSDPVKEIREIKRGNITNLKLIKNAAWSVIIVRVNGMVVRPKWKRGKSID